MSHEMQVERLGLELPPAPKPVGTYVPAVRVDKLLYVSGHGPLLPDQTLITGKVGADLTLEQGVAAARTTGLGMLATLRSQLGSLDRVARVVKVFGLVNATPDFTDHPKVINGFTDLMVEIFADSGWAARSAVGAPSLPMNIAVEVEAIFEIVD
ncbi:Endoribonuclease L-PSP [Planctomycetes bacterium Pan216]|uniref:Endoribonuclease L-PSP n=1 Tax=Kolteria novifilia TaxID=2527975 RepID=A0A518B3S2_9BACT|nr:Endoribonuclease L-PSP [Planctomycetes bacterium Pan216]